MDIPVKPVYHAFRYTMPRDAGMNSCSGFGELEEKLGLYRSHVPAMDEGWTRWVLEQEHFKYLSLEDSEIRSGDLKSKYKVIVLPDQPHDARDKRDPILEGHKPGTMPPEYTGGLGEEGVKALREFVEQGGTLIFLNRASDFAIEQFKLPVRDVVAELPRTDFFVPGSILRIELDTNDPITKGMPKESIAWVENSPVFEVIAGSAGILPAMSAKREPADKMSALPAVRVIAWYPRDRDPLLSGWLLGGDRIKGKAALVEVGMGKGRVILFGFRPQYRAQSLATYPLFFNAIANH